MPNLRFKVPSNDGEYLEVANDLQASYNARECEFEKQLRRCHNVIADLTHAVMKQEMMIDAYVQTLALIQKSELLKRSSATADHLPTSQRLMTSKGLNHYRQTILKDLEEDRWDQATFIGSIVDVANWRGSKSIQYYEEHKNRDFITEARTAYGYVAVQSGTLWRPENARDDDAPDPIEFYQALRTVATGCTTPPHNNEDNIEE